MPFSSIGLSQPSREESADTMTRDSSESPVRFTDVDASTSETSPLFGDTSAPRGSHEGRIRDQKADDRYRSKLYAWCMLILFGLVFLSISLIYPMASIASQEYAREATTYQMRNISIVEFTASGVRVEVEGAISINSSCVKSAMARNFGRLGTSIMRSVETYGVSQIKLYAPTYDNSVLATVEVPSIKADIRDHHTNDIDFIANVTAHDTGILKNIAIDYINDDIQSFAMKGVAEFSLISGFLSLGTHQVTGSHRFKG